MKITTVETFHLRHALSRATGPASVLNTARSTLLVRIGTDEGLVGWGETAPLAGVRATIDETYAPLLIGRDPLWVQRGWRTRWLAPFESGLATGAVDIALHDVWGKALGVPVHQLYGGALRRQVVAYASGLCYLEGVDPADRWLDEALGLAEQGFRAIKMRIGRYDPAHELPLVAQVRAALPSHVKLMVDAWGSYTLPTALRVGRALQEMGLAWYEEPLPQAGYHAYEVLAAELDIAVAGGEMLQTRDAFRELFERRAVDIVQPDVSLCGGITDLLFVADLAADRGAAARSDPDARHRRAAPRARHHRESLHLGAAGRAATVPRRRLRTADRPGARHRGRRGGRPPVRGLSPGRRTPHTARSARPDVYHRAVPADGCLEDACSCP
jgi:D-galactarolactone cycloisomerase